MQYSNIGIVVMSVLSYVFRATYEATTGISRVRDVDGKHTFSRTFNVGRDVIQGDIVT